MSAVKSWVFTINNYTDVDIKKLTDMEKTYLIYGKEVGESGTPHLQGFLTLKRASRMSALKKILPTAHWEASKATDAAINYCMKDGDYTIIDNRHQGARNDLKSVASALKDNGIEHVVELYPECYIKYHSGIEKLSQFTQKDRDFKPKVTWIYGPTGSGKTRYVYDTHKDSIWCSGKTLQWWDGYNNQDTVLLDDFRADFCTFHELLRILDRYPYTVQVKGSTRKLNSKNIYITSCYHPSKVYQTREDVQQLLRRIDEIILLTNINGEETDHEEKNENKEKNVWQF